MDFGHALAAVKNGGRVTRSAWAAGTFLYLVPGSTFQVNRAPLLGIYPEGTQIRYRPHIDIRGADGTCSPWQPAQDAVLADDWVLVPDETACCDLHGRNCEPLGDLCCEECTEARHAGWVNEDGRQQYGHPYGEKCSNPDLSDGSVTVNVEVAGGTVMSDEDAGRLSEKIGRRLRRLGDGGEGAGARA